MPIPADVRKTYAARGLWDDVTLRDGIDAVAMRTPDRIAADDGYVRWTFGDLDAHIARAVAHLRRAGVEPGSAVLVIAPLIAPAVVTYHAVLRAGAVAVMLDRRCGPADVQHAAMRCDIAVVIATPALADRLGAGRLGRPILAFDDLLRDGDESRAWPEPDPRRTAAVVFTSGTTSGAKGVAHSLNTVRSGARNLGDALEVTDADVCFLASPLASITGLIQTHLMLDRGGGLVLEDRFDAGRSLDRLCATGATVIGSPPVIVEELLGRASAEGRTSLPLRTMALGGAMIPRPTLELAVDRYGIRPVRMYGSSEVPAAIATRPSDEGEARLRDDGACFNGTEMRTDGEVPGELLVRGPMRLLGYLDEEHNADAFTSDGWYRTGDLARIENDRLTITGRLKEVVARKGKKISLAEIDTVAAGLPGVREVVSFGVSDEETGERLVLAVSVRNPADVEFEVVIDRMLGAGLATWKLPEQIDVWAGPFPRTSTGKIQRRYVADSGRPVRILLAPRLRGRSPAT